MLLETLKQRMLLPEKEIFINKAFEINGCSAIVICITSQSNKNILWMMYHQPVIHSDGSEEGIEHITNREDMVKNISNAAQDFNLLEIIIQGHKMTFSSSTACPVYHNNINAYMQLQHFIGNGMSIELFDKIDLSNIVIASYEQNGNEVLPQLDLSKELNITLKIKKSFREVIINQPLHIEFGNMEKGQKFSFYDYINKTERFFYIDSIEHYDIWQEAELKFNSDEMQHFSKEQIGEVKKQYMKALEENCPKGMNLAMLKYEAENNIQLNFYTKEFLDGKPVKNKCSSSALFFISDNKLGINSLKTRLCMLKPIPKDFKGSMDIELFSWIMEIPEYSIEV